MTRWIQTSIINKLTSKHELTLKASVNFIVNSIFTTEGKIKVKQQSRKLGKTDADAQHN